MAQLRVLTLADFEGLLYRLRSPVLRGLELTCGIPLIGFPNRPALCLACGRSRPQRRTARLQHAMHPRVNGTRRYVLPCLGFPDNDPEPVSPRARARRRSPRGHLIVTVSASLCFTRVTLPRSSGVREPG